MEFSGKIAVVTGAGNGIGERTAQLLAERGATVVVQDYNRERAQAVAQEIADRGHTAMAVSGDVAALDQTFSSTTPQPSSPRTSSTSLMPTGSTISAPTCCPESGCHAC